MTTQAELEKRVEDAVEDIIVDLEARGLLPEWWNETQPKRRESIRARWREIILFAVGAASTNEKDGK